MAGTDGKSDIGDGSEKGGFGPASMKDPDTSVRNDESNRNSKFCVCSGAYVFGPWATVIPRLSGSTVAVIGMLSIGPGFPSTTATADAVYVSLAGLEGHANRTLISSARAGSIWM